MGIQAKSRAGEIWWHKYYVGLWGKGAPMSLVWSVHPQAYVEDVPIIKMWNWQKNARCLWEETKKLRDAIGEGAREVDFDGFSRASRRCCSSFWEAPNILGQDACWSSSAPEEAVRAAGEEDTAGGYGGLQAQRWGDADREPEVSGRGVGGGDEDFERIQEQRAEMRGRGSKNEEERDRRICSQGEQVRARRQEMMVELVSVIEEESLEA